MDMTIITAIGSVTAIGLVCALMLAVASKVMAVETEERVDRLREALPGANCGACGYSGCEGYAVALARDGAAANMCIPGGDSVSLVISTLLGVDFSDVAKQIAVVHCRGDNAARKRKMDYAGIMTCAAEKLQHGGQNLCVFGCLGLGDCAVVCPNDAICIENGLAHIDTRKCSGCGLCAKYCPNGVIFTENDTITTVVKCRNTERGASVRSKCSCGCIACMRCVRECPAEAIAVTDNLARIDYSKCIGCGNCAEVCVTKCIQQADFGGVFSAVSKE